MRDLACNPGGESIASTLAVPSFAGAQPPSSLAWYDAPESVKQLLKLVAVHWHQTEIASTYMAQALEQAHTSLDVLITAYRYFFYKNDNAQALTMAARVLQHIRQVEQLPEEWERLQPILMERQHDPTVRLYLNAYSAYSFVLARLGDHEAAKTIALRVNEFEQRREFGSSTILDILTRPAEEDEDEL